MGGHRKHGKPDKKNKHNNTKTDEDTIDGKHGRIGRLDENTLSYYRRVSDSLNSEFESSEDRELFINNVFKQLCEEAVEVSRNQTVSRIVEELLRCADGEQLVKFMHALSQNWQTAIMDRFACYVTQTLLSLILPLVHSDYAIKAVSDVKQEQIDLFQLVAEFYSFIVENLEEFMIHTYASHIVRVSLEMLAGVNVSESVIRSRVSRAQSQANSKSKCEIENISDGYKEMLLSVMSKIEKMPDLSDHIKHALSNPVIQTLILVLHKRFPENCMKFCKRIIKSTDMFSTDKTEDGSLSGIICHEVGSHLVEQILSVATQEYYQKLFMKYCLGNLMTLALHPVANFTVQRIISNCHTSEQFSAAYDELSPHLEDLMAVNHIGIVLKIAEAALKFECKQDKFLKLLLKAFHCYKPAERQLKCVPLFAALATHEVHYQDIESQDKADAENSQDSSKKEDVILKTVNLHGSILMQQLFRFSKPDVLVSSLLHLKPGELLTLCCHASGSHVMDAFLKSPSVTDKNRKAVLDMLKGNFTDLACSKNGSRTMDTIWSVVPLKQKYPIAEELARHEAKLQSDKFGCFIHRNFAIHLFMHKQSDWKAVQTQNAKKRKVFNDILKQDSHMKKAKT